MKHPGENDLALFAGGDAGRIQHFLLDRHVRACAECREKMAVYRGLRTELAELELPDVNWNFLAADMRANIRLGLEAGACVNSSRSAKRLNPRLMVAFASLLVIVGSSLFIRQVGPLHKQANQAVTEQTTPVLRLTESGPEISSGSNSLTLLNHHGNATNQTVSAEGDIGARNIDGETGSVTINNVYLQ
jgi:hypothetical protein